MKTQHDLFEAITYGAVQRVRPKLMTVSMITLGLVPALWAHGAGAEAIQRIAAPMIGGLITSTILTLEIVPAIYSLWRGRQVEWVKGPRPPRKSWDELSQQFVAMEREEHGGEALGRRKPGETGAGGAGRRRKPWKWFGIALLLAGIAVGSGVWKPRARGAAATAAQPAPVGKPRRGPRPCRVALAAPQRQALARLMQAGNAVTAGLAADNLGG